MILLVPLNRYYVEYEVGVGQPYSELHTLVLRATAETEGVSVEMLQDLFGLPSRLLIEILIMLFKEGWIAVSLKTGGGFDITPQGREALSSNKPPQMRRIETRPGSILMERLTGMLIPHNEISGSYESKRELKESGAWEDAYQLTAEFEEDAVDEGQVQSLLRRDKREWIRHIKPPELRHKNWYYLPVDVNLDPTQMQVTGVPERWRAHLEPLLLGLAAEYATEQPSLLDKNYWSRKAAPDRSRDETTATGWQTDIFPDDLLLTSQQHAERLEQALAEAKSSVLIASCAVDVTYLSRWLREPLLKAVERGVHVSLLWGDEAVGGEGESSLAKWLEGGAGELSSALTRGLLSANTSPTNSHASLLIYDTDEGFNAHVGGYDWLSPPTSANNEVAYATVHLRHPGIVAELCRSVAAIFTTGHGNQLSSSPDRWRRIAEALDEQSSTLPGVADGEVAEGTYRCSVHVIRDQKHASLLSECLLSAQERCAVVSGRLGRAALRRLSTLRRRGKRVLTLAVRYGEAVDMTPEEMAALEVLMGEIGGDIQRRYLLRVNVVVADTSAIVGSHPFLSGNSFERSVRAHEVGVLIDGGGIPDELWTAFCGPRAKD
jgi:hypothetical protein